MQMTSDTRQNGLGWITFTSEGRWCEAKLSAAPSASGLKRSRVLCMMVGKTFQRDKEMPVEDQVDFWWDHKGGIKSHSIEETPHDRLPSAILGRILEDIEKA